MKFIFGIFPLLLPSIVMACPNCYSMDSEGNNVIIISALAVFIFLIYIPMFLLFKKAHKFRSINNGKDL